MPENFKFITTAQITSINKINPLESRSLISSVMWKSMIVLVGGVGVNI